MADHDSEPTRDDVDQAPPGDRVPPPLSVDQLTNAFAQLMGEKPQPRPQPDERTTDGSADDAAPLATDSEEETKSLEVTPKRIVEAILFVGHPENRPISSRLIASYLRGVSPVEVDEIVKELNQDYTQQQAPYQVIGEGEGYRMTLCPDQNGLRERFYGRIREARLSQTAVDLLAIVAYHQPIDRQEVDRLRGGPSGAILNQLVRRQLLMVERTTEKPRRMLYRTTDRFLDLFGIDSLDDLPRQEEIQAES